MVLVVVDAKIGALIFDAKGKIKFEIGNLDSPRGVYVTPEGEIYIAETGRGQISVFNQAAEPVRSYRQPEDFPQPTTVAVSRTGLIAVGDPVVGQITILNQKEIILSKFPITIGDTADRKPGLLWMPGGNLLYTDAVAGVLRLVTPEGKELHEWTGLQRPNDLALAPDGTFYLLEAGANRVVPMSIPQP